MNKHLLAALLVVPAAFSTSQAMADFRLNGTQINGLPTPGPILQGTRINGLPTPGPVFQGTQVNGVPTPGPVFQGTQVNGVPTPGPVFQGTQVNGVPTPGPVFQGTAADGLFADDYAKAGVTFQADYLMPAAQQTPTWSALPVSRMVVHVAPAI